jgi:chromatin structure-remodeling complex subunit RSC1/2
MNMSRARGPKYSLEYLTFIATKRKRRAAGGKGEVDNEEGISKEGGSNVGSGAKRPRLRVPPTVTETMREVWKEMRVDGYL